MAISIYGTINALMLGVLDGDITIGDLKQQGNCAIGTFNSIDGEMVADKGVYYQIKSDGKLQEADDSVKLPWAIVANFQSEKTLLLTDLDSLEAVESAIMKMMESKNYFYIARLTGSFDQIHYRSVCCQKKPYPNLGDLSPDRLQNEFTVEETKATIISFFTPAYLASLSVSGFHHHFYSHDASTGGHILGMRLKQATLEILEITQFNTQLLETKAFADINLNADVSDALRKIEKARK